MSDRFGAAAWFLVSVFRAPRTVLLCCAVLMGACTVRLVPAYDARIDEELTTLNTGLTAFVITMVAEAGTPQGEYGSNRQFYVSSQATLATLIARAEAYRTLGLCPSGAAVRAAVASAIPAAPPAGAFPAVLTPGVVLAQLPPDDCEVGLLRLVSNGFGDLQRFHQAQGSRGIPPSARDPILVGGVGSLLRTAIAVEISKKSGKVREGS